MNVSGNLLLIFSYTSLDSFLRHTTVHIVEHHYHIHNSSIAVVYQVLLLSS